jgi:hypothetical protein
MAITTINASWQGDVHAGPLGWPAVLDAASGAGVIVGSGYAWVDKSGGDYFCARSGLVFDTSPLGVISGINISSVKLKWPHQTTGSGNDSLRIVDGSMIADSGLVVTDYGPLKASVISFGEDTFVNIATNLYIVLSPAGIAAINKTGKTKFALRCLYDINRIDPGGDFIINHEWGWSGAMSLEVTYTILLAGGSIPHQLVSERLI